MTKRAKTYRIEESLIEELEVEAVKRGITMTSLVEDAIQAYIHGNTSSNTDVHTECNTSDDDESTIVSMLREQIRDLKDERQWLRGQLDRAQVLQAQANTAMLESRPRRGRLRRWLFGEGVNPD